MTRPRKALVSIANTPYYHITSRCVRRAYLCGVDEHTQQSYEHRRQWIVDRIRLLSSLFAIDVAAYAVMSNHYHLVLKLCPEQLAGLTDTDIIERWCCLFKGPVLMQRYRADEPLSEAEKETVKAIVNVWRIKLASLSWFMRCLNQPIARQANIEDGCTGKFWEYRFTSQALTSEEALLSCMAYVDLNPIRAGIATTPEKSDYTSIKERIHPTFSLAKAIREQTDAGDLIRFEGHLKPLSHFDTTITGQPKNGIAFNFEDYLQLVDWTGRVVRNDKRGVMNQHLPPILERLKISPKQWLINTTEFESVHRWRFLRLGPLLNSG